MDTALNLQITPEEFWNNSINPANRDAYFRKDYKIVDTLKKGIQTPMNRAFLQIANKFFSSCNLVQGEYLTACSSIMLATNRRIFIVQGDSFISVPLNAITFYGIKEEKSIVQYNHNNQSYTYILDNGSTMYPSQVNRNIERHRYESELKDNAVLATIFIIEAGERLIDYSILSKEFDQKHRKYTINYRVLAAFFIFFALLVGFFYYITKKHEEAEAHQNAARESTLSGSSSDYSEVVDVTSSTAVSNYLTSKTFRYSEDNMSIRFYPEGFYELKKDYEVALTGKWVVGERKYDSSRIIYLTSNDGNLTFMISNDGKIMDKASFRVFK